MSKTSTAIITAACLLAGGSALAQDKPAGTGTSGGGTVIRTEPVRTDSMQRLQQAADRLRESIQALAQKPPGPERERAISSAQEALLRTQQAMIDLPPELRSTGSVSTTGYDESVRKLMKSADSLRHAVQEMAQQPAGARRNEAIREANRALLDTHAAMAAAYQPGGSTQAMGAGSTTGSASAKTGASSSK